MTSQGEKPLFYQKNGWIIIKLAREIYNMEAGDRIPAIAQYAEKFSSGRGTVQTALNFLLDNGCIALEKQGRRGSTLTEINREELWKYTDWLSLFGALPFPNNGYLASLTSALHTAFREQNVPFDSVFIIASHNRLQGLKLNRYGFTVTNRLAVIASRDTYSDLEVVMELPGCVYSNPYAMIHRMGADFDGVRDGMRAAIYTRSSEQEFLFQKLSRHYALERVDMPQQEAVRAFFNGEVDFLLVRPEFFAQSVGGKRGEYWVSDLSYLGCDEDSKVPVVVANKTNYGMAQLLKKHLNEARIAEIQQSILRGEQEVSFF